MRGWARKGFIFPIRTTERDFRLSADTYFQRSTDSARLPGALVEDFTFTL